MCRRIPVLRRAAYPPPHQAWNETVSLMLGSNQFTGSIPDALYEMPLVTYLDISNNQ
jgi:hypothetical protein